MRGSLRMDQSFSSQPSVPNKCSTPLNHGTVEFDESVDKILENMERVLMEKGPEPNFAVGTPSLDW